MDGSTGGPERVIFHVDMDAFYAAVEARDRPELAAVPVVIGADPRGGRGRGVVSTANYPARRFGIRSAMPISEAYRRCPTAVFLRPSFNRYREASRAVMEVLADYADTLQVVGMDEAYLDVTDACGGDFERARGFARSLQAAVRRVTGLSCSVGVGPNKSVAKVASDHRKPHGVTCVRPGDVRSFLAPLPTRAINGCGPRTVDRLAELEITTVGHLAEQDPDSLEVHLGSHGRWLWAVARGIDGRPVVADRGPAKSIGNERTYLRDEADPDKVLATATGLLEELLKTAGRRSLAFSTLSVKLRYSDFTTLTRADTSLAPMDAADPDALATTGARLEALLLPLLDSRPVRLVGVRFQGLTACRQRTLAGYGVRVEARRPCGRRGARPTGAPRQQTIVPVRRPAFLAAP